MNPVVFLLVAAMVPAFVLIVGDAHAVVPNQSSILEGSGYVVTERTIKTSEVDIVLDVGAQTDSRIDVEIGSGLVAISNDDYLVVDSTASILRGGQYIRISATAESPDDGSEIKISTLGRLIQNSQDGSIYTFTGRIVDGSTTYKIVYIGQVSSLSISSPTAASQGQAGDTGDGEDELVIRILENSFSKDRASTYIGQGSQRLAGYFSQDRLTVTPGTSVTLVNDDSVVHTLVSGSGLGGTNVNLDNINICSGDGIELPEGFSFIPEGHVGSDCDFITDGRINAEIAPGDSVVLHFNERGFYRIIDPEYPWMNIVVASLPDTDNVLLRQGKNQLGN